MPAFFRPVYGLVWHPLRDFLFLRSFKVQLMWLAWWLAVALTLTFPLAICNAHLLGRFEPSLAWTVVQFTAAVNGGSHAQQLQCLQSILSDEGARHALLFYWLQSATHPGYWSRFATQAFMAWPCFYLLFLLPRAAFGHLALWIRRPLWLWWAQFGLVFVAYQWLFFVPTQQLWDVRLLDQALTVEGLVFRLGVLALLSLPVLGFAFARFRQCGLNLQASI